VSISEWKAPGRLIGHCSIISSAVDHPGLCKIGRMRDRPHTRARAPAPIPGHPQGDAPTIHECACEASLEMIEHQKGLSGKRRTFSTFQPGMSFACKVFMVARGGAEQAVYRRSTCPGNSCHRGRATLKKSERPINPHHSANCDR
jgi:hypothetical protein